MTLKQIVEKELKEFDKTTKFHDDVGQVEATELRNEIHDFLCASLLRVAQATKEALEVEEISSKCYCPQCKFEFHHENDVYDKGWGDARREMLTQWEKFSE